MPSVTVEQLIISSFLLTDQWDITRLPTDGDVSRGAEILSYIIWASPSVDIPFKSGITFNLTANKFKYTFGLAAGPGIDFVSTRIQRINFAFITLETNNSNAVTYPITVIEPYEYYMSPRVNSIQAIPQAIMVENAIGVSTVTLYPSPDQAYSFTMEYIQDISDFQRQQLITNVPGYYYKFLKFAVAREICMVYNLNWSDLKEAEYNKVLQVMESQNFHDITVRTSDVRGYPLGYRRILTGV